VISFLVNLISTPYNRRIVSLSFLGDLIDSSVVRRRFRCHWCAHRGLKPNAGPVADQRSAPPCRVSYRQLPDDYHRYPSSRRFEVSAHRRSVAKIIGHPRDPDNSAPLSFFASRNSQGVLVDTCNRDFVVSAFRSGAGGISFINDANLRLLCKCLLRVAAREVRANNEQLNYVMDLVSEVPSLRGLNSRGSSLLTPREAQLVALVAEGLGNRQIARDST
jgi:hypothetical protein